MPDTRSSNSDSPAAKALSLALAATVLFPLILYPLSPDAGIYASAASLLKGGGVLYRDVFAHQGPALIYSYKAALSLFSDPQLAVGILFFLVDLAGAYLAGEVLARSHRGRGRIVGTLAYAAAIPFASRASEVMNAVVLSGEAEDFQALCFVAALVLLSRLDSGRRAGEILLGVGALCGLALLYKPSAAPILVTLSVAGVGWWRRKDALAWKEIGARLLWTASGCMLPILLSVLYFAARGALPDYYRDFIQWNREVRSFVQGVSGWSALSLFFVCIPFVQLVLAGVGAWLAGQKPLPLFIHALGLGALLDVIWQGHYAHHHWKLFLVWTSYFSALALCEAAARVEKKKSLPPRLQGAALTLLAGFLALAVSQQARSENFRIWRSAAKTFARRQSAEEFRAPFFYAPGITYREIAQVRDHLQESLGPDEGAWVWGWYPMIPLLAGRTWETAYLNSWSLALRTRTGLKFRSDFMNAFEHDPPARVVTSRFPQSQGLRFATQPINFFFSPMDYLETFPELKEFLQEHYEPGFAAQGLVVFALKK